VQAGVVLAHSNPADTEREREHTLHEKNSGSF